MTKNKQPDPENYRESKPGLHHLYTVWAIKHLLSLRKCLHELNNHSNMNMNEAIIGLLTAYKNLLRNVAYKEAEEILKENAECLKEEYNQRIE